MAHRQIRTRRRQFGPASAVAILCKRQSLCQWPHAGEWEAPVAWLTLYVPADAVYRRTGLSRLSNVAGDELKALSLAAIACEHVDVIKQLQDGLQRRGNISEGRRVQNVVHRTHFKLMHNALLN